jgi:hypothetical protein
MKFYLRYVVGPDVLEDPTKAKFEAAVNPQYV